MCDSLALMLAPPEDFHQLRALLWAGPVMACLSGWGVTAVLGVPPGLAWAGVGLLVALGAVVSAVAVWLSAFGTRHAWCAVAFLYLLVPLPIAIMLLPAVWPALQASGSVAVAAGGLAAAHTAILAAASAWHLRRYGPLPALDATARKGSVWAGLRLHPGRGTWSLEEPLPGSAPPRAGRLAVVGPAAAGVLSVGIFAALKSWLPAHMLYAVVFVLANAMCLWLTTGLLSRALARAWVLRGWERRSGVRLAHPRAMAFAAERERSPLGRWLRRRMASAPAARDNP